VSAASAISNLLKILFLLLLIVVIVMGGVFWFDRLGIIDYQRIVGPFMEYLPGFLQRGEPVVDEPNLLEKELLGKQEQVIKARERELDVMRQNLEAQKLELAETDTRLKEEAQRLEEEKKVLSQSQSEYDNYSENVRKQAEYFTSMPPEAAVERLSLMDDLLVIAILREIDRSAEETGGVSLVPLYLSLMDADKAASVQRKMTKTTDASL
jgi:flagellar protein FlbB